MTTQEAIDHYGGIKKLADALSIWPQAIYKWQADGIPLSRQYELQIKTNGALMADNMEDDS